jgi:hypothetical protein
MPEWKVSLAGVDKEQAMTFFPSFGGFSDFTCIYEERNS